MKNAFLIISLLLITSLGHSQEYKDTIVTETETIKCKITLINDQNIFYDHLVKKNVVNDFLPLSTIKSYKQGELVQIQPAINSIDTGSIAIDTSEYAKHQFSYCEITTTKYPFRDKVEIYVNYGDGQHYITGKNSKVLSFSSPISALNYMGKRGWEIFSTYTVNIDNTVQVIHYLLKKVN